MNTHLYDFDKQFGGIVAGVDEAGRGCLAGDVFAAAVILPKNGIEIHGLDDSKKLSPLKRERLYDKIITESEAFAIATATVGEIEEFNILGAALLAMKRAYEKVAETAEIAPPDVILIDGNKAPELYPLSHWENPRTLTLHTIIGGDAKSASIAAASILAKVARDRYMQELDRDYPEYQFAKHKGYATKLHREMVLKFGASSVHRKLFLRKILNEES